MRAVLFDMDGVLIDSEPFYEKTEAEILTERGVTLDEETRAMVVGTQMGKLWQVMIARFGLTETCDALVAEEKKRYRAHLLNGDILIMPGASELVDAVQGAGLRTAIVSSSWQYEIETVMDRYGFRTAMDTFVSGEDVAEGKPNPAPYLLAAERLGVTPENCLVIEDSAAGVQSAKAAGMRCIALKRPDAQVQDVSRADAVVPSLEDNLIEVITTLLNQ